MPEKHLFRELTWHEVNDAVRKGKVVLVPVACIEQHGPHLPVDTDNRIVENLCEGAAARRPDLLLAAPPVHYGFIAHSIGYPGCINVEMEAFLAYLAEVARSFILSGFRKVLLVNGHGSNHTLCQLAARKAVNTTEGHCASLSWWDLISDWLAKNRESVYPGGIAHACEAETSMYLHFKPELVQKDKMVADLQPQRMRHHWVDLQGSGPVQFVDDWTRLSATGVEGDPTSASAEKGREMAELVITRIIEFCEDFRNMPITPRRDFRAKPEN